MSLFSRLVRSSRSLPRTVLPVGRRNFHPLAHFQGSQQWAEPPSANMVPIVIEQTAKGERAYDIFSRLLRERVIMLHGPIRDTDSTLIVAQLLFLEAEDSTKPIHLYINSPGGSVTAGLAIYDTYVSAPIHTYSLGLAASMGSLLLAGGEKGKRHCLPNASIMIHQPSGGASGQATDIAIHAKEILRIRQLLTGIYQRHCAKEDESEAQGLARFEKALERDYYMTAQEALDFGIIDGILEKRPPLEGLSSSGP
ncbi:ATP-dependent Clp protease proteolytic subunit [Ephemerocybe angulata]|uniref:ATP-dependent Clp protease proteolytic subunit n=1 Tax=Ephemerocybe angulata TaxID=980116 RepID=A0A8H6IJZ3_9AGAR|nr:ATP-dependent Clp protease proteolytic subunit [Tulosesus angulatus]